MSEPLVDDGDVDGGQVADGEFVVSGGHGPVLFELVDALFDGVAVAVDRWVECRWSATGTAAAVAVAGLVWSAGMGMVALMPWLGKVRAA
ncbi:hypothetical protein [Nocardia sp. NBC_01009]|uniref:hypothetical protein n=1 Tax=Nocardia sp. NBC_01009 TaxID=2975996 RepID=UPI00386AEBBB